MLVGAVALNCRQEKGTCTPPGFQPGSLINPFHDAISAKLGWVRLSHANQLFRVS